MKSKLHLFSIGLLMAATLCAITCAAQTSVTTIAAGYYHTLFIKRDGSLWGMGDNEDGALGNGTTSGAISPIQIVSTNVIAVAGGYLHSIFLKSDGSLWAMGANNSGQLGDGTFSTARTVPEMVVALGVKAISAGRTHSLYLTKSGLTTRLWAMGDNTYGELGDGTTNNRATPVNILSGNSQSSPVVIAIDAGLNFSLFLESDGSLWGMGYNADGELGIGTTNNVLNPVEIVTSGVTTISAGGSHALFLKSDGSLWAMGYNDSGELGDGTFNNAYVPEQIVPGGVVAIATGLHHSLFIKSDGSLWDVGGDNHGELGIGVFDFSLHQGTNQLQKIISSGVTSIAAGYDDSFF